MTAIWVVLGVLVTCGLSVAAGRRLRHCREVSTRPATPDDLNWEELRQRCGKLEHDRSDLACALVEIDGAAGEVLHASLAGGSIQGELHALDAVRGRIWATYNAASDVLKGNARAMNT